MLEEPEAWRWILWMHPTILLCNVDVKTLIVPSAIRWWASRCHPNKMDKKCSGTFKNCKPCVKTRVKIVETFQKIAFSSKTSHATYLSIRQPKQESVTRLLKKASFVFQKKPVELKKYNLVTLAQIPKIKIWLRCNTLSPNLLFNISIFCLK